MRVVRKSVEFLKTRCLGGVVLLVVLLPASNILAGVERIVVDGRSVLVQVPSGYDPEVPAPLLLELHGGGGPSSLLGFRSHAEEAGFLYAAPPGSQFPTGLAWHPKFTYCEALRNHPADDSAYLGAVVDSIVDRFAVDPSRIFVAGRSAGASMALRMACDHADVLAAFVSFESPWPLEEQRESCVPSAPVHALHITGTTSQNLPAGEIFLPWCPDTLFFHVGAVGMAEEWAGLNGCSFETEEGPPLDLSNDFPGNETLVTRYVCNPGGSVELWTMVGEDHSPNFTSEFYTTVIDWLLAHPKVAPACPFGLQARRVNGDEVHLTWTYGDSTPSSVDIFRDDELVADDAPVAPPEYLDIPRERALHTYRLEFGVPEEHCTDPTTRVDNTPPCDTHCNALTAKLTNLPDANVRVTVDAKDDSGDAIHYSLRVRTGPITVAGAGPQTENFFDLALPPGTYTIAVTVDDGLVCDPLAADRRCEKVIEVPSLPLFLRGDCSDDGSVDIADAVFSLGSLFLGDGDPHCDDACDSNDDGVVDTSDPITTLGALFLGDPQIPAPGIEQCGVDPTEDVLTCDTAGSCTE